MSKKKFKKMTFLGLFVICLLFAFGIVSGIIANPVNLVSGLFVVPFIIGATLTKDTLRNQVIGDRAEYPAIVSDIIYENAAVGLVTASGHARPLTSADKFAGFAERKADNSAGAAADINVRTIIRGVMQLNVSGAVITDVGQPVYATDDDTFVFLPVGGVYIGKVIRFVSSGVVEVQFDAINDVCPYKKYGSVFELKSANYTIDAQDSGKVIFQDTDAKAITLLATDAGISVTFVNLGAYGTVIQTISPNTADQIAGNDITAADNKDLINTKATAQRGDLIRLEADGDDGWMIKDMVGIWVRET